MSEWRLDVELATWLGGVLIDLADEVEDVPKAYLDEFLSIEDHWKRGNTDIDKIAAAKNIWQTDLRQMGRAFRDYARFWSGPCDPRSANRDGFESISRLHWALDLFAKRFLHLRATRRLDLEIAQKLGESVTSLGRSCLSVPAWYLNTPIDPNDDESDAERIRLTRAVWRAELASVGKHFIDYSNEWGGEVDPRFADPIAYRGIDFLEQSLDYLRYHFMDLRGFLEVRMPPESADIL